MFEEATILHADVDSFFAAVEQRDDPRLRGRPVIVGPGVVMAASYEARSYGIRSAMGARQARRLCPQAAVVAPRFDAYVEASRALFDVFERTAPTVEGLSLEEAFLDVGGLERISGSPVQIAIDLRHEVRERVGLPITVGIAAGRTLAKVASGLAKPDGLLLVIPGRERAFLRPLPVRRLWGVGAATAEKLNARGLMTVGQLAKLSRQELVAILGRASGRHVHALAHARDARRVRRGRGRRSIGSQSALGRATGSAAALDLVLVGLVDRVTRRMRAAGRAGRTVTLRIPIRQLSAGDPVAHAGPGHCRDRADPCDSALPAPRGAARDRAARRHAPGRHGFESRRPRRRAARAAARGAWRRRPRCGRGRDPRALRHEGADARLATRSRRALRRFAPGRRARPPQRRERRIGPRPAPAPRPAVARRQRVPAPPGS